MRVVTGISTAAMGELSNADKKVKFPSVTLFGIQVAQLEKEELLHLAGGWVREGGQRTIMYVNAHCLNLAGQDTAYREALQRADLVYPDGIGAVLAGRVLCGASLTKLTGADWIDDLCSLVQGSRFHLYILAGRAGMAGEACRRLQNRFPRLTVSGCQDGYFPEQANEAVLEEMNKQKPDLVLVGRGVPRQEKWITAHRSQITAPLVWGVGALFDYVAGYEKRAPVWMSRTGMEWLWRLKEDPSGKWRRYLIGNPRFLGHVLAEKLKTGKML